jgi:hypothetical protein
MKDEIIFRLVKAYFTKRNKTVGKYLSLLLFQYVYRSTLLNRYKHLIKL